MQTSSTIGSVFIIFAFGARPGRISRLYSGVMEASRHGIPGRDRLLLLNHRVSDSYWWHAADISSLYQRSRHCTWNILSSLLLGFIARSVSHVIITSTILVNWHHHFLGWEWHEYVLGARTGRYQHLTVDGERLRTQPNTTIPRNDAVRCGIISRVPSWAPP